MPKNGIQDLRNHLFEVMEALKDEEKPMDIERAKAIVAVADKIIDTARVEVKFLEVVGDKVDGNFFNRVDVRDKQLLEDGRNGKIV